MKILFFDDFKLGVLNGDKIVDVSDKVKDIPMVGPHDLINGLIENFENYRSSLEEAAASGDGVPVDSVRIGCFINSLILNLSSSIICNFRIMAI